MIVLGLMSGTSLDGLDLAAVQFEIDVSNAGVVSGFEIIAAETLPYSHEWADRLENAHKLSGLDLRKLDVEFGRLLGKACLEFITKHSLKVDVIASHGHSVFHEVAQGFGLQIGHGNYIKAETALPVVFDFRSLDLALGGQGAPLVPIGDELLFSEYDACLNLGGIANISYRSNKQRLAYDVSPCNLLLNHYALLEGYAFDEGGNLAKSGHLDVHLLDALNSHHYYEKPSPKSLDKEEVFREFLPILKGFSHQNVLRTLVEHIAIQIANCPSNGQMLATGGGALNTFLMERIGFHWNGTVTVPSEQIVSFKEALVFAFLGLLRFQGKTNVLSSVTGASRDSSSGVLA